MSLILEALKKSEAERRLGQVPGLMTPVQPTVRRRRSKLPLLLGAVAALVVAGGLGWWWLQPDVPIGDVAPAPSPADAASVASSGAPPTPAPASLPPSEPVTAPPVAVPMPRTTPPPAELPSDPDFVSTERESRPVTPDTPPPRERAPVREVTREVAAAPSNDSMPTPAPVVEPTTDPTIEPATDPAEPAAPPPPLPVPATLPTPALEALPRIGELTAAERESLPPLKLSMHVYAAEPAARFVLIDGQRLVEGARIANGLTLSEIRRDGAVVEFDGRRFLVPRL